MNYRAAVFVCVSLAFVTAHAAPPRPNIVVFLSDDMRWHHPGFNGGAADTPTLSRLKQEGTSLTQFYVQCVCSPTRAAFLTGRYPFRNGMEERSHGNDVAGMLTDERTLAQALQDAGYFTAIIGKWHLGNWHDRHLPRQRGFDHQYGLYGALVSYYDKLRDTYYDWHRNGETIQQDGYTTDLIAAECVDVIAARPADQPFFLYVPFNAVHGPHAAPDELVAKYARRLPKQSDLSLSQRNGLALQYAMIDAMDSAIGRVRDALKAKGVLDNTLILFFNDNGGPRENPPMRGGKGDTFEGGVRVPCLVCWPGHVPAGATRDGLAHVADLYPTLVNLAGGTLNQPLPIDGVDQWEMISQGKPSPRREVVHSVPGSMDSETGQPAIRQGDYKLVGSMLFDLAQDPAETTDIAADHPDVVRALSQRLRELSEGRRPPEVHHNISGTIDEPLLVFGEQENSHPPAWLPEYIRTHGVAKLRRKNK
jgi:arylsulfatase A-like enzyme